MRDSVVENPAWCAAGNSASLKRARNVGGPCGSWVVGLGLGGWVFSPVSRMGDPPALYFITLISEDLLESFHLAFSCSGSVLADIQTQPVNC